VAAGLRLLAGGVQDDTDREYELRFEMKRMRVHFNVS
jgi:hypothetical protein